jgi:hypothetical protein
MKAIATEFRDRRHREERKHRLNREIMAPEVRLSGPENEPMGIVSLMEACAWRATWMWIWSKLPPRPIRRCAG